MLSPAQEIKERLHIIDVVSSYIKLEKAGGNYKARCPFHSEKTPSFVVSPARGTYHCFGCNKGGDIFSFVQDIEGIEFRDALEKLASRAGVALKYIDPKELSKQKALYDCMELSARFFEFVLKRTPKALEYLKSRGLTEESISTWRIGYAPADWRKLTTFLREKKMSEEVIEKVGMAIKPTRPSGVGGSHKDLYDRFRGRIMFPIFDAQGRVVAFSGRIFDLTGKQKDDIAKYVNSPETVLYNKSKILYGYDKAKLGMLKENICVLVEGQVDLVMAHQVGTTNAVAVSGTALTSEHLGLIKRFTDNLVISFDGDSAGLLAAKRGVLLALGLGMDVKVAALPVGMDPADLIAKDSDVWRLALSQAEHIVPFYLKHLAVRELPKRDFIKEVSREVLPLVAEITNRIDQEHFIKEISRELGMGEEAVREELAKVVAERVGSSVSKSDTATEIKTLSDDPVRERLFGIYLWQSSCPSPAISLTGAASEYARISHSDITSDLALLSENKRQDLILQAEVYYAGHERLEVELGELLLSFEDTLLARELVDLLGTLAESAHEDPAITKKVYDIQRRRDEMKRSRFSEK
ncbi:MAG: DNA primase [Candidatus Pacebacteria bacterium]|jgi:DNA primase|nr:DNA primase [Candidatus Paceibacterota bacterium]